MYCLWSLLYLKKIRVSKSKIFTENSKSKKGHNSCKNEFRVISLVCTYYPPYSKHIFLVTSMLKNGRDMTKYHSFCITTTATTPRLQQYLGFSPKTAQLKITQLFRLSPVR